MLERLNWMQVRSLAELRVMTRASYVLLIIVPVLSGTWPAVRLLVNQYNARASKATDSVARLTDSLRDESNKLRKLSGDIGSTPGLRASADTLSQRLLHFDNSLSEIQRELRTPVIDSPHLPWSWATGFFAALFVVLGHAMYESPHLVKVMTLREHIAERIREFKDAPTSRKLRRANSSWQQQGPPLTDEQKLEMIERAASEEYRNAAYRGRFSAAVALLLYLAGLLSLLTILFRQAYFIAKNAGWMGPV
jgi:hypothetical protein